MTAQQTLAVIIIIKSYHRGLTLFWDVVLHEHLSLLDCGLCKPVALSQDAMPSLSAGPLLLLVTLSVYPPAPN